MTRVAERIISLSELYSTNTEFIERCNITNGSLISELKSGRMKQPGAEVLQKIVEGTGCSGSWLLTGQGNMFDDKLDNSDYKLTVRRALSMLSDLEKNSNGIEVQDLPRDLEIQLSELLLKVLRNRQ